MTNWQELNKIKIANCDNSFQHHEVVKLLLVMKILNQHRLNKKWIRIYTEHPLDNGNICDVYYQNLKDKSVICYEVQKDLNKTWLKTKTKEYNDLEVPYMKSVDFIPIPLKKLSKNLEQLNEQLDEYVY